MGFVNPILGGGGALVRAAVKSPNFLTGVSGWTIKRDGSAEFNNLVIRGEFRGTNFIIDSDGLFLYNGTPVLGNLIGSMAGASGVDQFGNAYDAGFTMGNNATNTYVQMSSLGSLFLADDDEWDNPAALSVQPPLSAFGVSTIVQSATNNTPPGDAAAALILDPGTSGTHGTAQFTSPFTGVDVDLQASGNLTVKNIQAGTTAFAMVAVTQMDVAVTFPHAFDVIPRVTATLRGSVAGSTALIVKCFNVTTSGMTLRVSDVGGVARTLTINADWHAIDT